MSGSCMADDIPTEGGVPSDQQQINHGEVADPAIQISNTVDTNMPDPVQVNSMARLDSPPHTQQTLASPSQQPTVSGLATGSHGVDEEETESEGGRCRSRALKPHLQGRFSGRLATKEDEKRLAEECRLLAPLLGGVGKRGDRSRMTLAKIVRGIATGDVRRHLEAREVAYQAVTQQLADYQSTDKGTKRQQHSTANSAGAVAAQQQIKELQSQLVSLQQQLTAQEQEMNRLQANQHNKKRAQPDSATQPGPNATMPVAAVTAHHQQSNHMSHPSHLQPMPIKLEDLPPQIAAQLMGGAAISLPGGYQVIEQNAPPSLRGQHFASVGQHHQQVFVMQPHHDQIITLPSGQHVYSNVMYHPTINMNQAQANGQVPTTLQDISAQGTQYVTYNHFNQHPNMSGHSQFVQVPMHMVAPPRMDAKA